MDFKVETRGFWQQIYNMFLLYSMDFWEVATGGFWKQSIICFYYIMELLGSRGDTKMIFENTLKIFQKHCPNQTFLIKAQINVSTT